MRKYMSIIVAVVALAVVGCEKEKEASVKKTETLTIEISILDNILMYQVHQEKSVELPGDLSTRYSSLMADVLEEDDDTAVLIKNIATAVSICKPEEGFTKKVCVEVSHTRKNRTKAVEMLESLTEQLKAAGVETESVSMSARQ